MYISLVYYSCRGSHIELYWWQSRICICRSYFWWVLRRYQIPLGSRVRRIHHDARWWNICFMELPQDYGRVRGQKRNYRPRTIRSHLENQARKVRSRWYIWDRYEIADDRSGASDTWRDHHGVLQQFLDIYLLFRRFFIFCRARNPLYFHESE